MDAGLLRGLESEGRGGWDRGTDDGGLDDGAGGTDGPDEGRLWEGEDGGALRGRCESSFGAGRLAADDFVAGRGSGVSGTGSEASEEDASKLGTRAGVRAEGTSRFDSSAVSMAQSSSISAVSASGAMLRGGFSEVGASEGAVGTLWTRVEVDLGESDAFVWLWSAPLAGGALWASVGGSASRPAATCSGPIAGLTWSVDFGWLGRRAFLERLAMSPSPRSSLGLQGIQVCECEMASALEPRPVPAIYTSELPRSRLASLLQKPDNVLRFT